MTVFTELTTKVYAAFGHEWSEYSIDLNEYTEITDYVLSVSVSWGRRSWLEDHRAATAIVTLRDPDRRFEPEYASGTYYPDVVPWVPIFITLDRGSSTDSPVFAGYVESWRTRYPPGDKRGIVTVRATDALGILARYTVDMTVTGDTGDQMVADILDDIGWPDPRMRQLTAGTSTLQSYTVNTNALAACQLIARSEGGSLYAWPYYLSFGFGWESCGPWIKFDPRYSASGASSSAGVEFSDDHVADSANPYRTETIFEYAADGIFNRAEVTRIGGTTQTHTDATSIDSYGERTKTLSGLLLATDAECDDYARYIVARHKDPARRITVKTQLAVGGLAWDSVPGNIQSINSVLSVKRRPQGGAAFTEKVIVEGGRYQHTTGKAVRLTYFTRPYQWYQWWALDSDHSSQLEETTRLGW